MPKKRISKVILDADQEKIENKSEKKNVAEVLNFAHLITVK